MDHIRKLPKINWEEINAGQEVYDGLCVGCHGLYGRGDGDWASQMSVSLPDLSTSHYQKQHSRAEMQMTRHLIGKERLADRVLDAMKQVSRHKFVPVTVKALPTVMVRFPSDVDKPFRSLIS